MKRCLIFLTAVCVIMSVTFAGCALPFGNAGGEKQAIGTEAGETGKILPEETGVGAVETSAVPDTTKAATEAGENGNTAGVQPQTGKPAAKIAVTLYYQDGDGYLIPLTRWIDKQEGIAKAAIKGLIDSAPTREELQYYGVYPVLPVNTEVLGINIKEGTAVIDFNKNLLNSKDQVSERNMVASVVYTLTEFKTIENVRILVNGYPQGSLKFGADLSEPLCRKNVSINTADTKVGDNTAKADIYYFKRANEGFTYLLPVSVGYGAAGDELNADTLVSLLFREKTDGKLQSEMPAGAKLIGSSEENGVLSLNFDAAFTKYGGNSREEGILKQLAYTVRQMKSTGRIRILVEGNPAELPEGTDISKGLAIPSTINDYIDR